ncbi:MAG: GLPGLI family protein [Bacteroides sp.]|nr:GLPGLI family protein [Bacteroides sp.]
MTDTTAFILGYECIMAEIDYHGHHWQAWFSPDIPVNDGPWKVCGLSGLILLSRSKPIIIMRMRLEPVKMGMGFACS